MDLDNLTVKQLKRVARLLKQKGVRDKPYSKLKKQELIRYCKPAKKIDDPDIIDAIEDNETTSKRIKSGFDTLEYTKLRMESKTPKLEEIDHDVELSAFKYYYFCMTDGMKEKRRRRLDKKIKKMFDREDIIDFINGDSPEPRPRTGRRMLMEHLKLSDRQDELNDLWGDPEVRDKWHKLSRLSKEVYRIENGY